MTNFRQGTELQSVHVCDFDPTTGGGVPLGTPNMLLIRTDNNSLYYYAGPLDTDWRLLASGGVSARQVFNYVATGAEANPFTVNLPAARASVNYGVQATFSKEAGMALKGLAIDNDTITINGFDLETSDVLELGDIIMFTVEDLT